MDSKQTFSEWIKSERDAHKEAAKIGGMAMVVFLQSRVKFEKPKANKGNRRQVWTS